MLRWLSGQQGAMHSSVVIIAGRKAHEEAAMSRTVLPVWAMLGPLISVSLLGILGVRAVLGPWWYVRPLLHAPGIPRQDWGRSWSTLGSKCWLVP